MSHFQSLQRQYLDFLSSGFRNRWLQADYGEIYVRKSARLIDGSVAQFLDIANIDIFAPFRRKGVFGDFLAFVETHNPRAGVFIELVGPKFLGDALAKRGYRKYFEPSSLRLAGPELHAVDADGQIQLFQSFFKFTDESQSQAPPG